MEERHVVGVGVVVVGVVALLFGLGVANARPPADVALEFLAELGVEDARVSCAAMDTDGDGYVSCGAMAPDGTAYALECTVLGSWCRFAPGKPGVRR